MKNTATGTVLRTAIVGKGAAGRMLQKEIAKNKKLNFVGYIDDFKKPVLGKISQLKAIILQYEIHLIYIAMPSVKKEIIKNIYDRLRGQKVTIRILPSYAEVIQYGEASIYKTKRLEIEDILGRPPIKHDFKLIQSHIKNKRVFISGAAGSIGSELAYQVALSKPKELICFDKSETPLFFLKNKLKFFPRVKYVVGDILDEDLIRKIFSVKKIDLLLHAAAYKHVALMEENIRAAILNNIKGSNILLSNACSFGVSNVVIVSTDKAVKPTSVMGATKRVVEKLMEYYSEIFPKSKISAVRFGNVLRSNGSVVSIFEDQIRKRQNLTITHPKASRYFMTIEEAAQLILLSGLQGKKNEIFVLDMGAPVKIVKLAEEMIRLFGFVPYVDIGIDFTGLKPGEKLSEKLAINSKRVRKTKNKKIFIVNKEESFNTQSFYRDVSGIGINLEKKTVAEIKAQLRKLVPSYRPVI